MLDSDEDWAAAFAELAVLRLESDRVTAETMLRQNSIEREHKQRGRAIDEKERLRQLAIRLCRRAGFKSVNRASFTDHTKNQLLNVIREAEAVISESQRGR